MLADGRVLSILCDITHYLRKISPETFRHVPRIQLRGQPFHGQLPRGQRIGLTALLPFENGDAVQHGWLIALQVKRMLVIGQRVLGTASLRGVIRKLRIGDCFFRRVLQLRLQIALGLRILFFIEVFAVARAVVEPHLTRKLLIAVRWMSNAFADGRVSAERTGKGRAHLRSVLAQIEPCQPGVGLLPHYGPAS